jgi:hypothetical protein
VQEETPQVHRPRPAVGVIGIDVADQIGSEIHQRHDMTAGPQRGVAQADRRSQLFVDGEVENASSSVARILDTKADACFQQRFFQAARTARAGVTGGEAVNRVQTVVACQRLQGAPAAAPRWPILDPALGRDVNRRLCRRSGEQQGEDMAAESAGHTDPLLSQSRMSEA